LTPFSQIIADKREKVQRIVSRVQGTGIKIVHGWGKEVRSQNNKSNERR